jgi:hypothetical protein
LFDRELGWAVQLRSIDEATLQQQLQAPTTDPRLRIRSAAQCMMESARPPAWLAGRRRMAAVCIADVCLFVRRCVAALRLAAALRVQ